jgi:GT2 family glycosyltransferase
MRSNKTLTIVALNWKGWEDTIECLERILNSSYQNFSIILIDNASSDNLVEKIKDYLNNPNFKKIKTNFPEYLSAC